MSTLDLRYDQAIELSDAEKPAEAITALNTLVNNRPDYGFTTSASMFGGGISPNQYYQAPQERVSPSTIRLGFAVYF
jgi:hypothetical protein